MALNIKPFFPLNHPDPVEYEEDDELNLYTDGDPLDQQKEERENRAKDHNYLYLHAKLKINVIS